MCLNPRQDEAEYVTIEYALCNYAQNFTAIISTYTSCLLIFAVNFVFGLASSRGGETIVDIKWWLIIIIVYTTSRVPCGY